MDDPFSTRRAGVLCPVFALRTEGDLGIGDTEAVHRLIDWAADIGLQFIQLLPINATGSDNSPYNAISSVALDPLTLDLSPNVVPELPPTPFTEACARHQVGEWPVGKVDYPRVRALYDELLDLAHAHLLASRSSVGGPTDALEPRRAAFTAFCAEEAAWLEDYCLFRVLMDRAGHEDWPRWPETWNTGIRARAWLVTERARDPQAIDRALSRHAYAQWLCAEQWSAVRAHADRRGVALMGDVPFGVSWCSADVFFHPEEFDLDWCGGAPPETYFKDDAFVQKWGQNWGIPLYRWDRMRATGYQWWRQRIRKLTDIFSIFRVDHVLGFYRIYAFPWRPELNPDMLPLSEDEAANRCGGRRPRFLPYADDTDEHQSANLAHGDTLIRMLVDAAGSAEIVAEDLGTVPEYVRPHLLSLNIPGFKICQWEDDGHGHTVQGAAYPNCSFATFGTHDHEPIRTLWERLRQEAATPSHEAQAVDAARQLKFLSQFAWLHPELGPYPPFDDTIRRALLTALLQSGSRLAAITLPDLFGAEIRFNVPGIAADHNWSARLPMTLAEMQNESPWRDECHWLAHAITTAGRAPAPPPA